MNDSVTVGVACTVCEYLGHFCQAVRLVAGPSRLGICKECGNQKQCLFGGERKSGMGEFRISDQVCGCGCDTHLSQVSVDRGWKFLRGHKAGVAQGKLVNKQPSIRPGKVMAVGMEQVKQFLLQNDTLIVQQLEEARNRKEALVRETETLDRKILQLLAERPKFRAALKALESPVGA